MARPSKKEQILRGGLEVVRERGFARTGVRDITRAAGVPQGSFTNHFASKDAFGLEILDRYFADVVRLTERTLGSSDRPAVERLRSYFDAITERFETRQWRHGCLIGNMSLEATEHSDALRGRLAAIFEEWREPFARCVAEAQAAGHVRVDMPPLDLADFLLASWQGAILRMKVERSPAPLERFEQVVFSTLLVDPGGGDRRPRRADRRPG